MLLFREKVAPGWLPRVLSNLPAVLVDHAHLERKAATTALNLEKYRDLYGRVAELNAIAIEEMQHFQLVLDLLQRRGIPTGLVTGNLTRIGWKKMERAGLRHYFHFGVFAEMASDRTTLARMAIERARRRAWIQPGARVSLIGDAPSDIIAARENGARSIAVHTGISTREELAALSPDMLLEDLRALRVGMLV